MCSDLVEGAEDPAMELATAEVRKLAGGSDLRDEGGETGNSMCVGGGADRGCLAVGVGVKHRGLGIEGRSRAEARVEPLI